MVGRDDPPETVAASFALGVAISFTPLIGLHWVIALTLEPPPGGVTHWSVRRLAKRLCSIVPDYIYGDSRRAQNRNRPSGKDPFISNL